MAFNINTFKSTVAEKGLLSTAKFKVVITPPFALADSETTVDGSTGLNSWASESLDYGTVARSMEFFCQTADMPGLNTYVSESRRYGYGGIEKKPITIGFNECQMVFLIDGRGDNARFFHNWMKLMVNYDARKGYSTSTGIIGNGDQTPFPFEVNYKQDYRADIKVHLYNNSGDAKVTGTATGKQNYSEPVESMLFTLREAYPIYIPNVPLNWEDRDGILKLPVIFTFFDWYEKNLTYKPSTKK